LKDEELYKLISDLVRIPSLNPPGSGLKEISSFIKDWLSKRSVSATVKEYEKGWPVLISESGAKDGESTIMLNGHMDVVPVGERSRWKSDPFSGEVTENKILGRGSTDMKAGLGVFIYVMSEFLDSKKTQYKLIFSAVSDEETGGANCSKHLADEFHPNFVISGEPTHAESVVLGEKGLLQVKLTSNGTPAHGSIPSLGENAISMVIDDAISLSKISKVQISIPSELTPIVENTRRVLQRYLTKIGARENKIEEIMSDVRNISFNLGVINGGLKVNVVADRCELEIDMRIPPGISSKEALEKVKSLVKHSDVSIINVTSEPSYTSPDEKFVQMLSDSVSKTINTEPIKWLYAGATDGRYFRYKGIPTAVFGPGEIELAHTHNEYVLKEQVDSFYGSLRNFLLNTKEPFFV
jgi:succinyl-diaminopimelate desuccinylase